MEKFKVIVNLMKKNGKFLIFFLAALCCLNFVSVSAQETPKPKATVTPSPKPKQCPPGIECGNIKPYPTPNKKNTPTPNTPTSPVIVAPRTKPIPPRETKKVVVNEADTPAEKSILTESKVSVNLCVIEGSVRINGWDRDEIRAYVEDGSEVGFKVVQYSPKSKKPVWVSVLGFNPQKNKEIKPEECLSGREIELDVPRNATIKLKSGESEVTIESVTKASVENLSGDIFLNDIPNGVEATTYEGDLMVQKSGGQMVLNNTAGNIIALDVVPSEIGDIFKAKTSSGRITLKSVEHRLIETNSTSGSTTFEGELLSGGQYGFSTQNGSIVLAVPSESACKINAWFGFGAFASEIPLTNTLKKEQSLSAQIGTGEITCSLNLKTGSGSIKLIKGRKPATKEPENTRRDSEKNTKPIKAEKEVSQNLKQREKRKTRNRE